MNQGEITQSGLEKSTIRLGKALNDPIKGVTALSRVGVTFTDGQKEQIRVLVESGRTMDAQKIILKELGSEFGGAAEAAADPWSRLQVIFGNVKESIGTALLPALNGAATFLADKFIPAVRDWWQTHGPKLKELWEGLATTVQTFYEGVRDNLEPQLARIKTAWAENRDAILGFSDAITGADDASTSGADAVRSFGDAMVAIITTAGKVSSAMQTAEGYINGFNETVQNVGNWIHRRFTVPIVKAFGDVVGAFLTGNHKMIAGAATVAEALHLPMAKSLRKAEQAMGGFVKDFNANLNDIDDEGVDIKLKSTFTPPKGFSMHSIVGARHGYRIPGYGGGDRVPIMAEAGEAVVPKEAAREGGFQAWAGAKGHPGVPPRRDHRPSATVQPGRDATHPREHRRRVRTGAPAPGWSATSGRCSAAAPASRAPCRGRGPRSASPTCGAGSAPPAMTARGSCPPSPTSSWAAAPITACSPPGRSRPRAGSPAHAARVLDRVASRQPRPHGRHPRRGQRRVQRWPRCPYGRRRPRCPRQPVRREHLAPAARSGQPGGHERFIGFDQGGWLQPGPTLALNNTGRPEPVGFDYDELAAAIARNPPQVFLDRVRVSHELRSGEQWNAYRRGGHADHLVSRPGGQPGRAPGPRPRHHPAPVPPPGRAGQLGRRRHRRPGRPGPPPPHPHLGRT